MAGINVAECLRIFKVAVDSGSFSDAGKLLNISPAWVAKSVTHLEKHLNTSLLIRSTRSLKITDAGLECYDFAEKITNNLQSLEEQMQTHSSEISGTVRINLPTIFGMSYMGEISANFQRKYPKINLELTTNDHFVDVLNEGYDIVLRIAHSLNDSNLIVQKLREIPRVLCATPEYLSNAPPLKTTNDIYAHRCLLYIGLQMSGTWDFEEQNTVVKVSPTAVMKFNNSYMIKSALLANGGIAYLPKLIVDKEIQARQLINLSFVQDPSPLSLYILRPPSKYLLTKTRVFINFLTSQILN